MHDTTCDSEEPVLADSVYFGWEAYFVPDPLLPPPSSFLPHGAFVPRPVEARVPCYMLAGYFVANPVALPPSAYFGRFSWPGRR